MLNRCLFHFTSYFDSILIPVMSHEPCHVGHVTSDTDRTSQMLDGWMMDGLKFLRVNTYVDGH